MKAFAICKMVGGYPEIDQNVTPYKGHVLAAQLNENWGCYLISGTGHQLLAIDALPGVYGICAVTENENVKWGELDEIMDPDKRTRINTWLANNDYPTIPAGWTSKQVVMAIYKRMNANFDLYASDIIDI